MKEEFYADNVKSGNNIDTESDLLSEINFLEE